MIENTTTADQTTTYTVEAADLTIDTISIQGREGLNGYFKESGIPETEWADLADAASERAATTPEAEALIGQEFDDASVALAAVAEFHETVLAVALAAVTDERENA